MISLKERTIERILATEPDERKAQEAIDRLTRLKAEINQYIKDNYKEDFENDNHTENGKGN